MGWILKSKIIAWRLTSCKGSNYHWRGIEAGISSINHSSKHILKTFYHGHRTSLLNDHKLCFNILALVKGCCAHGTPISFHCLQRAHTLLASQPLPSILNKMTGNCHKEIEVGASCLRWRWEDSTGLQWALECKILATKLLALFSSSEDRHLSQLDSGSWGKEEIRKITWWVAKNLALLTAIPNSRFQLKHILVLVYNACIRKRVVFFIELNWL